MNIEQAMVLLSTAYGKQMDDTRIKLTLSLIRFEGTGGRDPAEVVWEIIRNERWAPTPGCVLDYFHGVRVTLKIPHRDYQGCIPLINGAPAAYDYIEREAPACLKLPRMVDEAMFDAAMDRYHEQQSKRHELEAWAVKALKE